MAGTPEGFEKAKKTIRERYGLDENGKSNLHKEIGSAGGKKTVASGKLALVDFSNNRDRSRRAGMLGGRRSKRGHKFLREEGDYYVYVALNTGEVVKYKHGYKTKGV